MQPSFKSVIEDSSRNKYLLYYSGTSLCCKSVSKDGATRDTIIASQVSDNFLAVIDLQDRIYAACQNNENQILIFQYTRYEWKLEHILNIQSSGNIILLSLFANNGAIHILYAKQMAVANFFNIFHLYKQVSQDSYAADSSWQKINVCEMYAEELTSSYSAIMSREGNIHIVCEWFDGKNYLIDYSLFDSASSSWKKKVITTLFKKDISLSILYEEGLFHLLCYTYEDETSAIFYYLKKEGSGKDFEFNCVDKIDTKMPVTPFFHVESSAIYVSWIIENRFYQYALNKEQKNWSKKLNSTIPSNELIQLVEYIRNRKSKYWIVKRTYFSIDYKYNINLPYFKDSLNDDAEKESNYDKLLIRNADGDLVRYIPYLIDEVKSLSQLVKAMGDRLDLLEKKKSYGFEIKSSSNETKTVSEQKLDSDNNSRLKKSNFKDQFMKSNKLLNRPEATAIFVGAANIPNHDDLSKKEGIDFVGNNLAEPEPKRLNTTREAAAVDESTTAKVEPDSNGVKDNNLFKKIGDFFK